MIQPFRAAPSEVWHNISTSVADDNGAWQCIQTNLTNAPRFDRSYAH
jgi:hypothetical protein